MSEPNRDDNDERGPDRSHEIFAQLDDEYAREILVETVSSSRSAHELSEACDASLSTIYRRAERLIDCGLLAEQTVVEDDGNHYSVYEARLDRLTVDLDEEGFSVTFESKPTETLSDRFTDMWEEL
ncbi:hypothetical protein EL22_01115 [Halostagnicola sp. A56]|uniref:winged helix-turn-helix domain-containing protein n=1 Tax=Halostagnicola sp. A56 TaxID=1495067 RepID=UPI00065F6B82|nr:hypothetical protein EL22_01115 [Halostagnicola sp. A56]